MGKTKFKDLLKSNREQAGVSVAQLAKGIEKSEGYIRKIENYGYTPPTYAICNRITSILELTDAQRKQFMKQAFLERIHTEMDFYDEVGGVSGPSPASPAVAQVSFDDQFPQYAFYISWNTYEESPLLTQPMIQLVEQFIADTLANVNIECQTLIVGSSNVHLVINPPKSMAINDFILGLKSLSAGHINSSIGEQPTPIWNKDTVFHTIGSTPNIQFENVDNSAHVLNH